MDRVKERGDEALYDKLDSAYPTDEEDSEVRQIPISVIVTNSIFDHYVK